MKKFTIKSLKKDQVVDITNEVNAEVAKSGLENGLCHLMVLHTTVALSTADLDPGGTDKDYIEAFRQMIPRLDYKHPHDPSHMPDHILSSLIGTSITLPIENGALVLGTWQRVVLFEFNGPQERSIIVNLLSV